MGSWAIRRFSRLAWLGAGLAFWALALAWSATACDGSDEEPVGGTETPGHEVAVTENSALVASFPNQAEAAEKASELAGFEVLPVEALPEGFQVVGFNVIPAVAPGGRVRSVQVAIRSSSGGLLITQLSVRASSGDGDRLDSAEPGEYFRRDTGEGVSYSALADDRTYTLTAHSLDAITDDEAVAVLSGFVNP